MWARVTPQSLRTAGYLVALVAGSVVAVVTFDRALATLLAWIPSITTVDLVDLLVLIVFFLAYSVAAHSLDRLVIDAIRTLMPR